MSGWMILLFLVAGLGLMLIVGWWRARRPGLIERVSPHLRSRLGPGSGAWETESGGVVEGIASAIMHDAIQMLDRWGSPTSDPSVRLRKAGSPLTAAQYRAEQVIWGIAGLVVGVVIAGLLASNGASTVPLIVMVGSCGLSGLALREQALSHAVRRREARLVSELPTIADMLALAVSAGEGAVAGIERIAQGRSGVLAEEFRVILGEVRTGTPLSRSLHSAAGHTGVPAFCRLLTGVAIAVERGTPLADVLHAQALDVREASRRALIEEGGKREIAMMVPVIFLLLPVTVVFAVFPGIFAIRFGV